MRPWSRHKPANSTEPVATGEPTPADKPARRSALSDILDSPDGAPFKVIVTTDEEEAPVESGRRHPRGPRALIEGWFESASLSVARVRGLISRVAHTFKNAFRSLRAARSRGLRAIVSSFFANIGRSLRETRSRGLRATVRGFSANLARMWRGPRARRTRSLIKRFLLYTFLFVFVLWYLTPIYVLLVTSLKGSSEINLDTMWVLPTSFDLSSFGAAWKALAPNFMNSLMLAIPAAILSSIVGSLNGYVLAKWKFRGSEVLFTLILFGMFIPYQSILIPLTQVMSRIGLYGSLQGLVLVHIIYGIPITTLIFRNYYAGIPTELLEAAKVDGAGFIRLYRSILLPLSASGFVVVLIWQFNSVWNDFLFAVTLIPSQSNWPVTVALNNLSGSMITDWNVQMAGALIAATPTLLIFIILGRYFVRGLLAGSLKG